MEIPYILVIEFVPVKSRQTGWQRAVYRDILIPCICKYEQNNQKTPSVLYSTIRHTTSRSSQTKANGRRCLLHISSQKTNKQLCRLIFLIQKRRELWRFDSDSPSQPLLHPPLQKAEDGQPVECLWHRLIQNPIRRRRADVENAVLKYFGG